MRARSLKKPKIVSNQSYVKYNNNLLFLIIIHFYAHSLMLFLIFGADLREERKKILICNTKLYQLLILKIY